MNVRRVPPSQSHGSRLGIIVRGLGALLLMAILGIGIPVALIRFVPLPVPSGEFSLSTALDQFRTTGIGEGTVVKALALIVWFAWIRLVLGMVVEIASRLAHREPRQVRGLGSSQRLAGRLVTAVLLMISSFSGLRGAGAATPAMAHATGSAPSMSLVVSTVDSPMLTMNGSAVHVQQLTAAAPQQTAPTASEQTWTVRRNDSFWGIAESTLGDGQRWREVVEANVGREVAPGVTFTATTEAIRLGTRRAWHSGPPDRSVGTSRLAPRRRPTR
jgi:hypothetical protein